MESGVRDNKKPTRALRVVRSRARRWLRAGNLQWRWVTNGLSELTRDFVLRREIDLLEQLGRDGQAARGPDLPQRIICIMAAVEVVP